MCAVTTARLPAHELQIRRDLGVARVCHRRYRERVLLGSNNFGELGNGTTDNAMEAPQLVGVQAPGSGWSRFAFRAPSGRTRVLVGILGFLAFLGVRILRTPS